MYKLKKALYRLKQAPRARYSHIESYFVKQGFKKCPYEHTLFIKVVDGGKILIFCLLFMVSSLRRMNIEWKWIALSKSRLWEVLCTWLPLNMMLCLWWVSSADTWNVLLSFIYKKQRGCWGIWKVQLFLDCSTRKEEMRSWSPKQIVIMLGI